jgi:ABC-2 type transport system permease protein
MTALASSPTKHIIPATLTLLQMRWRITFSGFRRAKARRKFGIILVGLLILAGMAFLFGLSWGILRFLQSPMVEEATGGAVQIFEAAPILMVSVAFMGILMTSFGVLLQGLYLAGDMDFLLSSPIPIRSVFLAKLLQAILPNWAIISLFALPVLYGLGAAGGYNILYYPFVLIVISALALAAAGVSALLVMSIVRIFPARRVAKVLGFVGAILAMVMSQAGNILNMSDFSPEEAQIGQALNLVERANSPWMPLSWAGRGLIALGEGNWLPALGLITLTLGICLAIFWFSLVIAERLFYSGWAGMQVITNKKKTHRTSSNRQKRQNRLFSWIPGNLRAIVWKDLLLLRRDLRNLSQLVTPLIFGIIYSFMLLRNGGEINPEQGEAPTLFIQAMKIALVYSSVGIAIFVGWMLLSRLALISFSQEHNSYWILKSAPVSVLRLLAAKFLVAFLPTITLGAIFLTVIVILQGVATNIWVYGLFVVVFSNAGLTGISLAFGVVGARFDWKDPRKMSTSSAGCLLSIVSMIYIVINLGLFFAPPILFTAVGAYETYGHFLGGMFGGIMSLIFALLPPWMVRKRVPLLAESN